MEREEETVVLVSTEDGELTAFTPENEEVKLHEPEIYGKMMTWLGNKVLDSYCVKQSELEYYMIDGWVYLDEKMNKKVLDIANKIN